MALEQLEATLQKQWRLGQSIVLCWAFDPNGLLTLVVPHYFLGNFTAPDERVSDPMANETFVRELLSAMDFADWSAGEPDARAIEFTDKYGLRQQALSIGFTTVLDDASLELGARNR